MSKMKNGESLKTFSKWLKNSGRALGVSTILFSSLFGSASAYGMYDPCCEDFNCCETPDYTLYADFIYWQVNTEGLDFAFTGLAQGTIEAETGQYYLPGCDFQPGFRVGGFIDLGCCEWDFYAQYTWLHSCSNTIAEAEEIFPLIAGPSISGPFNRVKGENDIKYNVLDFGLGRTFCVNDCFEFRPHFGLKATWQEHDANFYFSVLTEETTETNAVHNCFDFNGIGIRGGFDAAWKFSDCFSFVGGLALSSVYSDIDVKLIEASILEDGGEIIEETIVVNTKFDHCALVPVLELLVGLRWDTRICECYDAYAFIGWENQVWFGLNKYLHISEDTQGPHGNVTYQGLTVRLGIGF